MNLKNKMAWHTEKLNYRKAIMKNLFKNPWDGSLLSNLYILYIGAISNNTFAQWVCIIQQIIMYALHLINHSKVCHSLFGSYWFPPLFVVYRLMSSLWWLYHLEFCIKLSLAMMELVQVELFSHWWIHFRISFKVNVVFTMSHPTFEDQASTVFFRG